MVLACRHGEYVKRTNEIFSSGKYRVENKTVYMSGRFVLLHEWSISAGNTDNECKHLLKSSTLHPLKEKKRTLSLLSSRHRHR